LWASDPTATVRAQFIDMPCKRMCNARAIVFFS